MGLGWALLVFLGFGLVLCFGAIIAIAIVANQKSISQAKGRFCARRIQARVRSLCTSSPQKHQVLQVFGRSRLFCSTPQHRRSYSMIFLLLGLVTGVHQHQQSTTPFMLREYHPTPTLKFWGGCHPIKHARQTLYTPALSKHKNSFKQ